jgi:Tol biopolymer transport system component
VRGVIVFASRQLGLFQVSEDGGSPISLTSIDTATGEDSHRAPSFLPDGRHVLFLVLGAGQTRGVIYAVSMEDGARTRVTESSGGAAYEDGMLLTTTAAPRVLVAQAFDPTRLTLSGTAQPVRDQLEMADTGGRPGFSVSTSGALAVDRPSAPVHQLTWLDRAGRPSGKIGPASRIDDFALAPDEQLVIADIGDLSARKNDLWLFDGQRQAGTRLTFQLDTRRPIWSRDGLNIWFRTMPGFRQWSLRLGGTTPEETGASGKFMNVEDVTRDGRYQVLLTPSPGRIWMQEIGELANKRKLVESEFPATGPRVSPDGRWPAYSLTLPGGPEVFVQPFDRPGGRQQVSTSGGIGPVWRADGRELFFEAPGQLMAAAISPHADTLDVGTPQPLFAIHTQGFVNNQPHNVEVAANGQKFLVNTIVGDSDNAALEVTLNWMRALRK